MQHKKLKKILNDPRVNVSGICKSINEKGLSRSSVLNKLNDDHRHILKDEDAEKIEKALRKLSQDIIDILK